MNIKYKLLMVVFSLSAILLAACSGSSVATVSASSGLSTATKLALGTLKLENTANAVSASQAAQLLTLWQGYQSLSGSDTTSQIELDALVKQIESSMTSDQLKAIDAMSLNDQSLGEEVQSLGSSMNEAAPASTPSASAASQSGPGAGAPPGGMPGGGDSVMSVINGGTTTQSTPAAMQSAPNAQSSQASLMLIQALIRMLETMSHTTG